jgi:hypothetical protein
LFYKGESYPCWNNLPKRPLNGQRATKLYFYPKKGVFNTSHVVFSCNPHYNLVGEQIVYCKDGEWDRNSSVKCILNENICTMKPELSLPELETYAISLERRQIQQENSFEDTKTIDIYISIGYTCDNNKRFQEKEKVMRRMLKNDKDEFVMVEYIEAKCIDMNKFEMIPKCV